MIGTGESDILGSYFGKYFDTWIRLLGGTSLAFSEPIYDYFVV